MPEISDHIGTVSASALDGAKEPRHRWYFFKEAFSPALVRFILKEVEPEIDGFTIVDPFCGGGTSTTELARQGIAAAGTEVNPFLSFVARAKSSQATPRAVRRWLGPAKQGMAAPCPSPLEGFSTFSERRGLDRWLFNTPVLQAFQGAWQFLPSRSSAAVSVVKLALIGAAMDTCNAFKDGKCLRYRPDWSSLEFGADHFREAFQRRTDQIVEDLEAAPIKATPTVTNADSRRRSQWSNFGALITSPPYLNSFDYTDIYRPELFLGGFVRDMGDLRALRFRTMRSHVQVDWRKPRMKDHGVLFARTVEELEDRRSELWNGKIVEMVRAYFEDLEGMLRRLANSAAPGATAWITVSTSAYAGIEIPVDLIMAEIAGETGWQLREVRVLRYLGRVAGQQWHSLSQAKNDRPHLRESMVVLERSVD